jgi:thymidylate synthase ThyX
VSKGIAVAEAHFEAMENGKSVDMDSRYLTTVPHRAPHQTGSPRTRRALPVFHGHDRPVFALINLPETVKGALVRARSRRPSLRRLFLDSSTDSAPARLARPGRFAGWRRGRRRADKLRARVERRGDDSVAQLGGAHIACEYVSNVLTKVLEWGRLMAYLEQSTRYVPYMDKMDGRWKYMCRRRSRSRFASVADDGRAFDTYARAIPVMEAHFRARYPKAPEDSDAVYRSVIRAKALDTLRGLLPAAPRPTSAFRHRAGVRFLRMQATLSRKCASTRTRCSASCARSFRRFCRAWISRTAAGGPSNT